METSAEERVAQHPQPALKINKFVNKTAKSWRDKLRDSSGEQESEWEVAREKLKSHHLQHDFGHLENETKANPFASNLRETDNDMSTSQRDHFTYRLEVGPDAQEASKRVYEQK